MLSRCISCFDELHFCFLFSMKEFAVIFHKQYDDTVLSATSGVGRNTFALKWNCERLVVSEGVKHERSGQNA